MMPLTARVLVLATLAFVLGGARLPAHPAFQDHAPLKSDEAGGLRFPDERGTG